MAGIFSRMKEKFMTSETPQDTDLNNEKPSEDYVELGPESIMDSKSKVIVRPFSIENFEDVKLILDSVREGFTIALVNIRPLKEKDIVELKRAINKIKKTCDAVQGDIAGFGEDWIVVTPSFAKIHRNVETTAINQSNMIDE